MDSLSARNLRSQQIMFARRFIATRQAGPIIIPRQTSCLCQVQQDVEKEGFALSQSPKTFDNPIQTARSRFGSFGTMKYRS